jgi:hypothetical protein
MYGMVELLSKLLYLITISPLLAILQARDQIVDHIFARERNREAPDPWERLGGGGQLQAWNSRKTGTDTKDLCAKAAERLRA